MDFSPSPPPPPPRCLHCGAHSPIYKPLWAISSTVDKPGNITEAAPPHLWFMFLAKYKAPKARHINILEWSTWKYLMDWGERISVASHSHLPFCEQSVFPCSRQRNLGTTAGVSVSPRALFVREPGSEPSRHRPSTDATVTSAWQEPLWALRGCGEHIPPVPNRSLHTTASMAPL